MDRENILALVRAGFNAEEIKIIVPDAFASEADNPSIVTPAQSDAAGAAQPSGAAASAPEPAPAPEPAEPAAPAPAQAPAWFADYERAHNEQIAQLQRALQVRNVRDADEPNASVKSQEDLMREAFLAITN